MSSSFEYELHTRTTKSSNSNTLYIGYRGLGVIWKFGRQATGEDQKLGVGGRQTSGEENWGEDLKGQEVGASF